MLFFDVKFLTAENLKVAIKVAIKKLLNICQVLLTIKKYYLINLVYICYINS